MRRYAITEELVEQLNAGEVNAVRQAMLDQSIDVNDLDDCGWTMLGVATSDGHTRAVELLLTQFDADVDAPLSTGTLPIFLAVEPRHTDIVRLCIEHGSKLHRTTGGNTVMLTAASFGHVEIIRMLAEAGANINRPAVDGRTPLCIAAVCGHIEALEALIQLGADVNAPQNDGVTPVCLAAGGGRPESIRVLVRHGADVFVTPTSRETCVYNAAYSGFADCIEVLAEFGADIDKMNVDGYSPVYAAASLGHSECVRTLGKLGADIIESGPDGYSPLLIAAQEGHVGCVRALIEFGADINSKTNLGMTAVSRAAERGHMFVVSALAQLGADLEEPCNDGKTPMEYATMMDEDFTVMSLKNAILYTKRETSLCFALKCVRQVMMVCWSRNIVNQYLIAHIALHLWLEEYPLLREKLTDDESSLMLLLRASHERAALPRERQWLLKWADVVGVVSWCREESERIEREKRIVVTEEDDSDSVGEEKEGKEVDDLASKRRLYINVSKREEFLASVERKEG